MNGFTHKHLWIWADEICRICGGLTCEWMCISCQLKETRCRAMGDDEVDE